ncbi:uncharacterized protein A4U43_C03F1580 [Asparagus officinalis]|uniref:Uncharacterized protein n=1 Tax=Asparagus officinalis TaxID=4686 RepID=A0A5P1F730_ASPOF|nr:uncharacterized protein A4U43_C03F1580 [Asparagus officinalis]
MLQRLCEERPKGAPYGGGAAAAQHVLGGQGMGGVGFQGLQGMQGYQAGSSMQGLQGYQAGSSMQGGQSGKGSGGALGGFRSYQRIYAAIDFPRHGAVAKGMSEEDVVVGALWQQCILNCGNISDRRLVFDLMRRRNTVTSTAMVSSLCTKWPGR